MIEKMKSLESLIESVIESKRLFVKKGYSFTKGEEEAFENLIIVMVGKAYFESWLLIKEINRHRSNITTIEDGRN